MATDGWRWSRAILSPDMLAAEDFRRLRDVVLA
jgi:hypothetical protein